MKRKKKTPPPAQPLDAAFAAAPAPVVEKPFVPSRYQQDIFDWISNGSGNATAEAVAGSGKTSTIIRSLDLMKGKVLFCAFNKHIATELQNRAPRTARVSTIHSLGFSTIRKALRGVEINEDKARNLAAEAVGDDSRESLVVRKGLEQLTRLAKLTLTDAHDADALHGLVAHYDIDCNGSEDLIVRLAPQVLNKALALAEQGIIDFDDMVWVPNEKGWKPEQYDWVCVDECLPYRTPILLANGKSISIGDIVEKRLHVKVLAYNTKNGKQEACKITGWHKLPNQKQLVKIRCAKSSQINCLGGRQFVTCTVDHKIWTLDNSEWKWTEAGQIKPGMKIQVETLAEKSQAYKITTKGRKRLAQDMTEKNLSGITGGGCDGFFGKRGGNGRGLTIPQTVLLEALGSDWQPEYPVPVKQGRHNGYPTCYKLDIANPQRKIGVEIDARNGTIKKRVLSAKKDSILKRLGWKMHRYENMEAVRNAQTIATKLNCFGNNCPESRTVVSVEPVSIREYFVYDITVEHCHDFYANGILVHNCQDLNAAQRELVLQACKGRLIAVGDRHQSIYGFAGADITSIPTIIERLKATVLPLSICYRCPRSHVELAKQIVPQIEPREDAPEGVIRDLNLADAMRGMESGDLVICRINKPLAEIALGLIRAGKKAVVRGRDIGQGLIALVDKMRRDNLNDLLERLQQYCGRETEKLMLLKKERQADSLRDRVETIICLADGEDTVEGLRGRIGTIFSDATEGVVCSSVHKAKGLEANKVYIHKPELMPFPKATEPWEIEQEMNLKYVAVTRAKKELYMVSE